MATLASLGAAARRKALEDDNRRQRTLIETLESIINGLRADLDGVTKSLKDANEGFDALSDATEDYLRELGLDRNSTSNDRITATLLKAMFG